MTDHYPPAWLADYSTGYLGKSTSHGHAYHVLATGGLASDLEINAQRPGGRLKVLASPSRATRVQIHGTYADEFDLWIECEGQASSWVGGVRQVRISQVDGMSSRCRVSLAEGVDEVTTMSTVDVELSRPGPFRTVIRLQDSSSSHVLFGGDGVISALLVPEGLQVPAATLASVSPDFVSRGAIAKLDVVAKSGLEAAEIVNVDELSVRAPTISASRLAAAASVRLAGIADAPTVISDGTDVAAGAVDLHGSLDGSARRVTVHASNSVDVLLSARSAEIGGLCSAGINIGMGTQRNPIEVVDMDASSAGRLARRRVLTAPTLYEVFDLKVRCEGPVSFGGNAACVDIQCGGPLVVAGDVVPGLGHGDEPGGSRLVTPSTVTVGGLIGEVGGPQTLVDCPDVLATSVNNVVMAAGGVVVADSASCIVGHGLSIDIDKDLSQGSQLTQCSSVYIGGTAGQDQVLEATGDINIGATECPIKWLAETSAQMTIRGHLYEVVIPPGNGSNETHAIVLDEIGWIENFRLERATSFTLAIADTWDVPGAVIQRLEARAPLEVEVVTRRSATDLGEWCLHSHATLNSAAPEVKLAICASGSKATQLSFSSSGHAVLGKANVCEEVVRSRDEIEMTLLSGSILLERDLASLKISSHHPIQILGVGADVTVRDASGTVQLAQLQGRLFSKAGTVVRVDSLGSPARPVVDPFADGVLVGADLKGLDYRDIRTLAGLRVLELDRKAARRDSKVGERHALQSHAQRARDVADLALERSVTGGSRAAARWAAVDAAARTLRRRDWPERSWRAIHRWVFGYGFYPLPPALALVTWLSVLVGVSWRLDQGPGERDEAVTNGTYIAGPYSLGDQAARALLMPLKILRYDGGGAPQFAPYWNSYGWTALITAITAILVAGLVIASRNYLRSPHNRSLEDEMRP